MTASRSPLPIIPVTVKPPPVQPPAPALPVERLDRAERALGRLIDLVYRLAHEEATKDEARAALAELKRAFPTYHLDTGSESRS